MRNRFAALVIGVLLGFSTSLSAVDYCAAGAFGYGAGATGGGSATPVLVNSVSGLQSALNKGKNKVIIITQDLTFTTCLKVQDGENVTLLGMPGVKLTSLQQNKDNSGILYVKRFKNLIIRNLTFVGPGAYDCDGWDLLCFEGVTNAWVDHCDFQDGCDGNFDNKGNTDNVTVSWCRFRYLKAPKSGGSGGSADHRFTNLLGSSSSDKPSDGTFNFTWAYCWWDNGCKERMTRCRNCEQHFINCYWNSSVANYYVGPENAKCYFEGCTFAGKANTKDKIFKSYGGTNACKFVNCSGNLPSNSGTITTPSGYATFATPAAAVTAVTNASCGAGATLTVSTAGVVSSACDGGAPAPTVYTVTWDATTNGGSCGTATTLVTDGNAVGSLPEATKDGYTFDGWYTAPSGGTKISSSTVITGNVIYYAQFTSAPVTTYYTVIWDANGGSCGTASTSVESGKAISTAIASLPTASKAGDYSFDGWYTAVSGGTKITTGTIINANVTYYAHYTATGGGGGSGDETCMTFGTSSGDYSADGTFTNGNYTIVASEINWETSDAKFGNNIDYLTFANANGISAGKIYAKTANVQVTYSTSTDGSTGTSTETISVSEGSFTLKNLTVPANTKYIKLQRVPSTSTYVNQVCLTEAGSSSTPTFALYYDENGGSGTMAETEQTGSSVTVAANAFTAPTGYAFQEWNASMSGGGTVYSAGQELTLTEDLTIYAIWTPQSYTVTLNAESGTGGSASVKATFDEAMPSIAVPTRSGYIFKGYFTGVDGTGTQYYDENGSSTNSWAIPEDTELHAYWIAGSTPDPTGCELNFWFFKEADATANGKTNSAIFSGMVSDASDKSGSITIDGTSYSVTRRTGDNATFGQFTIPSGKTGVFYALAISSGGGDRQINLVCGTNTYELPVAGGSDSYKRIESEELPAGTYSIERDGSSNVRLGIVVVKICGAVTCDADPAAPSGLTAGSITSAGVTLTITDDATPTSYDIYYSTESTTPTSGTEATTTTTGKTKVITGLTPGTTYYAWVRAVCDASHKSAWVALTGSTFATSKMVPTSYAVGASAEGECTGGMTAKITLSGSQVGVDYQLKKDGVDDGAAKAGTGSALEWTGKGSGVYTVWAVENATYSALKMNKTVTIEVYATTAITTQPTTAVMAEIDESFTLGTGMAAAGNGLTYRWYTCGSTGTDTVFISGATNATYTTSQSITDTYYYRVRVEGTCGEPVLSDIIEVTITSLVPQSDAPTITVQPVGATYCTGDAVSALSVTASGSGTLSYQWKKDGVAIPSAEDYTYAPTEAGTYVCVVTNTESGKTPTSLSSDEAVVVIKAAVAAPTMSQTENTVTISTATSGATIYYTTNGTDPTTSSASGSSVTITADCTVKAYAVKDGCASSVTSFAATYDASACAEPALMTNEIARFFVPCGTGTIKYEVTDEASSTGMNTFSTYKLGSTNASNWYTNSTSKWSYGKMSSDTYIQIKLNTGHFQAYDKVYIYVNRNDASKTGVKLHSTSGNAINPASTAADEEAVGVRSLTDEDIETDGSLKFYRGGSNTFINRIIVVRPVPHSITYDCDGAESGCPSNVASAYALPNPLPNAPVKSGYSFDGWFTNSEKTVAAVAGAELTDDVTLYAKWSVGKNSPVFTWTYDATIKAGGTYPVSVATYGDADVTLSIKETIAGVSGSFTAGKPATGTVTLGSYPAAATFTYRATSPETTTYQAKVEEKTVTIERCETADAIPMALSNYVAESSASGTHARYYCEVSGVGRLSLKTGNSKMESYSSGTNDIFEYYLEEKTLLIEPYSDIHKIELYVNCGTNNKTLSGVYKRDTYSSSTADYSTSASPTIKYYTGSAEGSYLPYNATGHVELVFATPIPKGTFIYIVSPNSMKIYGVKLYRPQGDEATSVAFSGETEIEKYPGDAAFTKTATQTTTPILSGGSITYKSSDETVATVNKTTGEVTVLNTGRTNIIATLSAFGCFKSATASYSLTVKKCTDPVCTIAVTAGNANKCSGAEVTLTATAAAGASIQWYKDGVALTGETNPSLSTTAPGTYHATATKECLQKSNTIDVVNFADPTAEALHQYYYIKAGRVTPPIKLFQIANASSWDVSPAAPAGCAYELGEDGIIYLTGTPSASLTTGNQDITVTAHNDCGGSDAQATLNLRTLAATAKPQIAWVAIGTHLDGSDVKPTKGETLPGSVDASKSTSHVLYTYLQNYFDMTAVNAYCTTDTKKISDYCSQFDLVLLTDYPDTNVKPDGESGGKEKSYSNAYGCLMDELPLLSFEAFVADCPNWGINSNPKTPDPKQKDMTLLCSAHMIFEHTTLTDDVVEFLTTTDGAGNALQGFTSIDAPSGMIFIATINDGSNKLIVCCERQKVIEARMMIMGLNYDAMEKVSADGKTIIKQIIEYLLQFKDIADCSIVFDDNNGTHVWSDPQNWYPAYNAVPKAEQAVRVDKPCNVDIENAHCSSIRLRKDGATYDGKLTIQPNGGLTVIDYIKEVHGTNYMTTYPSAAADLVIQANESGRNGSLVFGNTEDDLQATVEYYSLARDAKTSSPVWQYIGIPITDGPMAIDAYHAAWMCSWENEGNVSSNWVWVENEDRIRPFKGYCITQQATKKYTHIGSLSKPEAKDLQMYYFESDDGNGFNMFANSWVAPIDITKMATADFGGAAEPTIFIYNTGSRDQYEGGGAPSTAGTNTDAGQFNAIPVAAASYLAGSLTKIPTMQGFFVQATKEGTLTLNYEKLCFDNTDYQTTAETMRAPKRLADDAPEAEQIVPEVMRLDVTSAKWGDRVYILTHEEFSDAFDRGWDGSKQEGDAAAPMLAVAREKGLLAVAAIETAEGRDLYFRAGEDIEYTFTFHYAGDDIYLYDRETGQATLIRTGNTYTFSAVNQAPEKRFIITANPLQTPTDIDHVQGDDVQRTKAKKFIYEDKLLIFYRGTVYDVLGAPVQTRKEDAQ